MHITCWWYSSATSTQQYSKKQLRNWRNDKGELVKAYTTWFLGRAEPREAEAHRMWAVSRWLQPMNQSHNNIDRFCTSEVRNKTWILDNTEFGELIGI